MKASELILALQKAIEEHGDLEVKTSDGWEFYDTTEVKKAIVERNNKGELFDKLIEVFEI